jgi:hypothetical protein
MPRRSVCQRACADHRNLLAQPGLCRGQLAPISRPDRRARATASGRAFSTGRKRGPRVLGRRWRRRPATPRRPSQRPSWRRRAGDRGEEVAGHHGLEVTNFACADVDPFAWVPGRDDAVPAGFNARKPVHSPRMMSAGRFETGNDVAPFTRRGQVGRRTTAGRGRRCRRPPSLGDPTTCRQQAMTGARGQSAVTRSRGCGIGVAVSLTPSEVAAASTVPLATSPRPAGWWCPSRRRSEVGKAHPVNANCRREEQYCAVNNRDRSEARQIKQSLARLPDTFRQALTLAEII